MAKALWVLNLSSPVKILVKNGQAIDQGDNLAKKDERFFKSPVSGQITKVSKDQVKIEFATNRFSGKAFGSGRWWGRLEFLPNLDFLSLDFSFEDKIIFINQINSLLVNKAEAIGVKAAICFNFAEKIKKNLPILQLTDDKNTKNVLKRSSGINCLVDLDQACLFIPEQGKKKNEN